MHMCVYVCVVRLSACISDGSVIHCNIEHSAVLRETPCFQRVRPVKLRSSTLRLWSWSPPTLRIGPTAVWSGNPQLIPALVSRRVTVCVIRPQFDMLVYPVLFCMVLFGRARFALDMFAESLADAREVCDEREPS
jgi:hypothetical protein